MASFILVNLASNNNVEKYKIIKQANIVSTYLQVGKPVKIRLENDNIIKATCLFKSDKIKSLMALKNQLEESGPNRSFIRSSVLNSIDSDDDKKARPQMNLNNVPDLIDVVSEKFQHLNIEFEDMQQ
ncbi:PREDICTED: uncharacterized protein LOC108564268 [Nicrophorus vespilloides]|uniref:Uncharacterized protein LOC108564268 n=1 Tax=Nicrophorus vespilloides TaxID=110193 RepID=A0ABM1MW01_NICVS|nr:PREDICTED: uncharacterized protein LOC108564268 [Nicrophorus vespilloides]